VLFFTLHRKTAPKTPGTVSTNAQYHLFLPTKAVQLQSALHNSCALGCAVDADVAIGYDIYSSAGVIGAASLLLAAATTPTLLIS
jgi:hypothetical protein